MPLTLLTLFLTFLKAGGLTIGDGYATIQPLRQALVKNNRWMDEEDFSRQVDGLMPKAIYSDNVLDSVSCFTTTQVAKELGITAQELNRSLC